MPSQIFPFHEHWPLYLGFLALVLGLLALDLGVFHRRPHEVRFKEALGWSFFWISLALIFDLWLWNYTGGLPVGGEHKNRIALEFLTGYLVEKSLSVDNIFIFLLVFSSLGIPKRYQHRVLFYGILGAIVFRILFIGLGSAIMGYHAVIIFFGIVLIATGIKILIKPSGPGTPEKHFAVRLLRKFVPITSDIHGGDFFTRIKGVIHGTPLLVALVFLEATDIVFAIDSVPAIFAITNEPFIVLTSNLFAILGLRSLYFLLADLLDRIVYLKFGLAAILIFVGLKMVWLNSLFGGKFPVTWSLGIIAGILGITALSSFIPRKNPNP